MATSVESRTDDAGPGSAAAPLESAEAVKLWLSERFAQEMDPNVILRTVAEAIGRFLRVSRVGYGEIVPGENVITIPIDWTDGVETMVGRRPLHRDAELVREYEKGRTLVIADTEAMDLAEDERRSLRATQTRAFVAVPLIHDGQFVALFSANHHAPREWSAEEVALVQQVGARTWAALQHARTIARLRESEEQFRLLADNMPGICWLAGPDGFGLWMNRAGRAYYGEAIRDPSHTIHPEDRQDAMRLYADSTRTGRGLETTVRMHDVHGVYHSLLTRTVPIRDATGAITRWCGLQFDITEQVTRSRHERFMRRLSDAIRFETDADHILATVSDMVRAHLAIDRVSYAEVTFEDDRPVFTIYRESVDFPEGGSGGTYRFPAAFDAILAAYYRGETIWREDMSRVDDLITPGVRDYMSARGIRAGINVPLVKDGMLAALLVLHHHSVRQWSADEIALVDEVAERTWATVTRARAEAKLRARERDQAFLINWSDHVRDAVDTGTILDTTLAMLGAHLDASRATYSTIQIRAADDGLYTIVAEWGPTEPSVLGYSYPAANLSDLVREAYLAGEMMVSEDLASDLRFSAEARRRFSENRILGRIGVPLSRDGVVQGILAIDQNVPRRWTPSEVALVGEVADRMWGLLERARAEQALKARERDQAFLLDWSDRLRRVSTADQVLALTLESLTRYLGGTRTTWSIGTGDGREFVVAADWCEGVRSVVGRRFSLADVSQAIVDQWNAGSIVRYDDIVGDPRVLPGREAYYEEIEVRAFVTVPLIVEGEMRASISVQSSAPRSWRDTEIQLIRDISERLWIALDRAAALAQLRQRERDQAFLIEWSDAVRGEGNAHAILASTLERVGRHLGVARANYAEADAAGTALTVIREWIDGQAPQLHGQSFAMADLGERLIADHLDGLPIAIDDIATDPRLDPPNRAVFAAIGVAAAASVSLIRDGRIVAIFSLQQAEPRQWRAHEIQLLREIADRSWATLERARSEQRLAESEALLAAFMERAPLGMHLRDANGRYIKMNPELSRQLGVPIEAMVGSRPEDFLPAPVADRIAALETKAIAEGYAEEEFALSGRDGFGGLQAVFFPITIPGGAVRTGGFTIEITERKRTEAALAKSRDALYQTEKLTALGSLLAGVSHELNNPLSIVVAQAVMMERQAKGTDLADRAFKIRKAADRCARIVQTFLAMARQKTPERAPVDLNQVAVAALDLAAYGLRTEGIAVVRALDPQLPQIAADADQLHQIIINLLINAQHALAPCEGERRVTISTARGPEPMTVVLDIADNGPGVPQDARRRIFEPFYTTKPQGEGTGVGLSFSQGLAEAHGGRLSLLRTETGATFRLTLPVDPAQTLAPVEPEAAPAAPLPTRRALVIDDEQEIAESLADFLSLEGYACDIAVGGVAAQARLVEDDYDLIVSDLRMPDVDGPALYAFVREHRPDLAARMGFATGDTLGASAARFLAEMKRPVLEKPFVPEAVRRFLDQLELS